MSAFGANTKAAFKIETADYGVVESPGSGDQLHYVNFSMPRVMQLQNSIHYTGFGVDTFSSKTGEILNGQVEIEPHYGEISLVACLLGQSHQDNSPVAKGGGAYVHYFEPDYDLADRAVNVFDQQSPSGTYRRRGTLQIDTNVSIQRFISVMVTAMQLNIQASKVSMIFSLITHRMDLIDDAAPSWSLPAGNKMYFQEADIRIRALNVYLPSDSDPLTINEGSGNINITVDESLVGYSGFSLARVVQDALNASGSLSGNYEVSFNADDYSFIVKSDVDFQIIDSGDDIGAMLGFFGDTANGRIHISNVASKPREGASSISSSNQVNVSNFTLNIQNSLQPVIDRNHNLNISQPFMAANFDVGGTFSIPRYGFGEFGELPAFHEFGETEKPVQMLIKLTGETISGSRKETMTIYIPEAILSNAATPFGNQAISQEFQFVAKDPILPNLQTMGISEYYLRDFLDSGGDEINCAGIHTDGLYIGTFQILPSVSSEIFRLDGNSWTSIGTVSSLIVNSFKTYKGSLYIGLGSGTVYVWDGSTLSLSTITLGTGDVTDMEVFDDELYAILSTDGATGNLVHKFNGTSWSTSLTVANGEGFNLQHWNGDLYATIIDGSNNGDLYEFDGTSWDSGTLIAASATVMSMTTFKGDLIYSADGTYESKESYEKPIDLGLGDIIHMTEWMESFILFTDNGSNTTISQIPRDGVVSLAGNTMIFPFGETFNQKPVIYKNRMFMPIEQSYMKYWEPPKKITISIENQTSTNPL